MSKQFLDLLFNPDETICVSHNQYGYHSIQQDEIEKEIRLISPKEDVRDRYVRERDLLLTAINPINGFRDDKSVTAYRSFLVELDDGSLPSQKAYIDGLGLPYSICIFSGNKSLHYGIVLKEDLVNESVWRMVNQWILNILTKADQQVKNPSRSIRFPGNKRRDGKGKIQALVEVRDRISQEELFIWLNKYPDKKPVPDTTPRRRTGNTSIENIPEWVSEILESGVTDQRNSTWFNIACSFARCNFDYEETVEVLENFFDEESDFKRPEWIVCIKQGFKRVNS